VDDVQHEVTVELHRRRFMRSVDQADPTIENIEIEVEQCGQDRVFGGEVVKQRWLSDPDRQCDVAGRRSVKPVESKKLGRLGEDSVGRGLQVVGAGLQRDPVRVSGHRCLVGVASPQSID